MKRKILYILLFVVLALIIARERGIVNFNYYTSNITGNLTSNWHNNKNVVNYNANDSFWRQHKVNLEAEHNHRFHTKLSLKELSVYVTCTSGRHIGQYDSINPQVYITINTLNHGSLWTPLYKSVSFNAQAICNDAISKISEADTLGRQTIYDINGTMSISGNLTVKGSCSAREARNIIEDYVMQQFYDCARKQLDGQEGT